MAMIEFSLLCNYCGACCVAGINEEDPDEVLECTARKYAGLESTFFFDEICDMLEIRRDEAGELIMFCTAKELCPDDISSRWVGICDYPDRRIHDKQKDEFIRNTFKH